MADIFDQLAAGNTASLEMPKQAKDSNNVDLFQKLSNTSPREYQQNVRQEAIQEALDLGVPKSIAMNVEPLEDSGIGAAFAQGLSKSVSGVAAKSIFGLMKHVPEKERTGFEKVARIAGELVGDIPGFSLGSSIGAPVGGMAGAAVGSAIPGAGIVAGAGVGSAIGAGVGAMALPSLIKSAYQEYEEYVNGGGEASFGGFLESAGNVAKQTAKSGLIGGLFGAISPQVSKLIPFLKKLPGMNKILNTKPGKFAAQVGAETASLTAAEAAVERKLPSVEDIAINMGMVTMMGIGKSLGKIAGEKVKSYTERPLLTPETPMEKAIGKATVKAAEKARFDTMADFAKAVVPEALGGNKLSEYLKTIPESRAKQAKLAKIYDEYITDKAGNIAESNFRWTSLEKAYEKKYGEITKQQGEDLLHYMQKQGNYAVGIDDSFVDVKKRLPKELKLLADMTFKKHFSDALKENNANPYLKKISPREGLENYYLPGLYEGSPEQIRAAMAKARSKLKISNPFANTKTFLTYAEAMREGGLKPRFSNPFDLLRHYDRTRLRIEADTKLLNEVKALQLLESDDFIVNAGNARAYDKALQKGYKKFMDPLLRSYKTADGTYKITESPALVSPEFAKEFSNVFSQKGFASSDPKWLKAIDRVNREVNLMRVAVSPFHYMTQLENIRGQLGLKKSFQLKSLVNQGRSLAEVKDFVVRAARAGLQAKSIESLMLKKGGSLVEKGLDSTGIESLKKIGKGMRYLHEEFIPNIKRAAFQEVADLEHNKFEQKYNRSITPKESLALDKIVAEQINNVFGGQNWEKSKFFRNKETRDKMRRFLAFPDWTISNLKQAMGSLKPGIQGQMGRKYMARYLLYNTMMASVMRGFLGSIYQKENGAVTFDPERGLKAIGDITTSEGPIELIKSMFSWTLPAIDIQYGPTKNDVIQFGRNKDGSRIQGRLGKQLVETGGYISGIEPLVRTLYNKTTPVIQEVWKQTIGSTPTDFGSFKVDPAYKYGKQVAWQGKKGFAQLPSRAKEIIKSPLPFGVRGGFKPWVESFFGSFALSKKDTLFKSEPFIEDAWKTKDATIRQKKLDLIREKMKDNRVFSKKTESRINAIKGQLYREKYTDDVRTVLQITDNAARKQATKDLLQRINKDYLKPKRNLRGIFSSQVQQLKKEGVFTKDYAEELLEELKVRKKKKK